MGQSISHLTHRHEKSDVMSLSFVRQARINFTNAPHSLVDEIAELCKEQWESAKTGTESGEYGVRYKAKVFPQPTTSERQLKTHHMVYDIIEYLRENGWRPVTKVNILRRFNQSAHFFKHLPATAKPETKLVSVSARGKSGINLFHPAKPEMKLAILKAAQYADPAFKLEPSQQVDTTEVMQTNFFKDAWLGDTEGGNPIRKFVIELFQQMHQLNFDFYGAIDAEGTVDTFFFEEKPALLAAEGGGDSATAKFWLLAPARNDRIRVITSSAFSEEETKELHALMAKVIGERWPDGYDNEGYYCGAYEFTLKGSPWACEEEESVQSRIFINYMLESLTKAGWALKATVDVYMRKHEASSSFIFCSAPSRQLNHLCVSLNEWDRLRLVRYPPDFLTILKLLIPQHWKAGVEKERTLYGSHELTLKNQPWKNDHPNMRSLLCSIIKKFGENGWTVATSAKMSRKFDNEDIGNNTVVSYPVYLHSIWFAKTG